MPASRLIAFALCAAALVLGGCGSGDFDGEATVPEAYERFSGAGVSFAYPAGWQVEETTDPDGAPFVEILPPDKAKTPYGLVRLSITPKAGRSFESQADQRRIVMREVNDTEIESDETVEIPGAEKALRAAGTTPPGRGNDPVEVRADSLDVLRANGDVLTFTAASPQRGEPELDPEAVVSSFRLAGA